MQMPKLQVDFKTILANIGNRICLKVFLRKLNKVEV